MRMQALRAGAVEFLTKPFDEEILLERVRAALAQ
jgi:FixJ family two-component response regulator